MPTPEPDARQPWEAPAVSDIDLAENTSSGGVTFDDEITFPSFYDNFPLSPVS